MTIRELIEMLQRIEEEEANYGSNSQLNLGIVFF